MQPRTPRILYIEDHEDTRDLVTLVLGERNINVTTTDTLAAGVRLAFDRQTPIIFYSAAAFDVDRQTALQCGAQGYLTKPCSNGDLGDLVERLIGQSSPQ